MRHGQSQANADHIVAGSHESPLSQLGQRQVGYAGETARQYFHFDLIVTSPMERARQSAQLVAEAIGYPTERIIVIEELRERNLGDVEGRDYAHAQQHNGNYEDVENVPGVEPIEHLWTRVKEAYQQLQHRPEKHILVVCHNGCGRMLRAIIKGGRPMGMYDQARLENAVFYQLT